MSLTHMSFLESMTEDESKELENELETVLNNYNIYKNNNGGSLRRLVQSIAGTDGNPIGPGEPEEEE